MRCWLADYVKELTGFPGGKHDDQVDSTTQFLEYVKTPVVGQGVIDYMKMMLEERDGTGKVRLKVPRGITHINTLSANT